MVCVTYGAGGHNVVNPIAGAYAEQVPLLVVSGGPGVAESSIAGIHHQVKDIEAQCRIFAEVTCSAKILKHADRAAEEIHELVSAIWAESRPGYLEIHRDLVDLPIPVPKHIVEWSGRFPAPKSDARKLREAVADVAERMGRPAATLYYHFRILEKVGLLVRTGSRPGTKKSEVLYEPVASRPRVPIVMAG